MKGKRDDEGKPRYDLLAPSLLWESGWEKAMPWLRPIVSWWYGDDAITWSSVIGAAIATLYGDERDKIAEEVSAVSRFGAAKYGEHNWLLGMEWHRVYRCILSHAKYDGTSLDDESKQPHRAHVIWNVMALSHYHYYGLGFDDRPCKRKQ